MAHVVLLLSGSRRELSSSEPATACGVGTAVAL
jgi:hypothetical protein